jgi:hypothetical protein
MWRGLFVSLVLSKAFTADLVCLLIGYHAVATRSTRNEQVKVAVLTGSINPGPCHQDRDCPFADLDPQRHRQLGLDSAIALGAPGGDVNLADEAGEPLTTQLPGRAGSAFVLVVGLPCDPKDPAALVDRSPGVDESIGHRVEPLGGACPRRGTSRPATPPVRLPASGSSRLHGLGRVARAHACRSATARYRRIPPLPATSRQTVDGDLPRLAAIDHNDRPAARPREISSRSARLNRPALRPRGSGRIPPQRIRWARTVLIGIPNARAVGLAAARNRTRISSMSAGDNR